jgi:hypothetical protein
VNHTETAASEQSRWGNWDGPPDSARSRGTPEIFVQSRTANGNRGDAAPAQKDRQSDDARGGRAVIASQTPALGRALFALNGLDLQPGCGPASLVRIEQHRTQGDENDDADGRRKEQGREGNR